MRVDFYQLTRDPVESVVPLLAAKALAADTRVTIASADAGQRAGLSDALWRCDRGFLAHGAGDAPDAARQPILIGDHLADANAAGLAILADGVWRPEAERFARAILLFAPEQTAAARTLWSELSPAGHELRIFKQSESGGWREGR